MSRSGLNDDEAFSELEAIQDAVDELGDLLSSAVPTKLYNARRSPDSTTAVKVLHVPELLKLILEHNTIFDVLNVYQTCHRLKAIVDSSPKLQTQLLLRQAGSLTDWDTSVKPHPLVEYGECWDSVDKFVWIDDRRAYYDNALYVCFRRRWNSMSPEFKVGQTWTRMQICQPALMSVRVAMICPLCDEEDKDLVFEELEFSTDNGLSLGDLCDRAKRIFEAPHAVRRRCTICSHCIVSKVIFAAGV